MKELKINIKLDGIEDATEQAERLVDSLKEAKTLADETISEINEELKSSVTALYFCKDKEGNRLPVLCETGSYESIYRNMMDSTQLKKIQRDFPTTKGNLFVCIEDIEFKVG